MLLLALHCVAAYLLHPVAILVLLGKAASSLHDFRASLQRFFKTGVFCSLMLSCVQQ